jgi:hypothetical protein
LPMSATGSRRTGNPGWRNGSDRPPRDRLCKKTEMPLRFRLTAPKKGSPEAALSCAFTQGLDMATAGQQTDRHQQRGD